MNSDSLNTNLSKRYINTLGETIKYIKNRDILVNFFKVHIESGIFSEEIIRAAIEQHAPEHMSLFNAIILLV